MLKTMKAITQEELDNLISRIWTSFKVTNENGLNEETGTV